MSNEAKWLNTISKHLKGATIVEVRYMERAETDQMYWQRKAVVLICKKPNGEHFALYPSADDEGNDAGALFTNLEDMPVIPVMY